jgi:hypothetical protein
MNRALVLSTLMIAALPALLRGQAPLPPTTPRAAVSVGFDYIGVVDYGTPQTTAALFLEGERVLLRIGISNGDRDRSVAAELNWPERITLGVRPGTLRERIGQVQPLLCTAGPVQSSGSPAQSAALVVLHPGAKQFFLCEVATPLEPGTYTVVVDWSPSSLLAPLAVPVPVIPQQTSVLGGATDFEIRAVKSDADHADLNDRLAIRALLEGRFEAVEENVEAALLHNPLNSRALAIRGELRLRQQQCAAGIRDLNRAAEILSRFLDPGNSNIGHRSTARRTDTARYWQGLPRQLGCA